MVNCQIKYSAEKQISFDSVTTCLKLLSKVTATTLILGHHPISGSNAVLDHAYKVTATAVVDNVPLKC